MTIPTFPSLIGLGFPIVRTPTWRSIKQEAISGKETRLQLWSYPRYKYEIAVDYLGSGSAGQNQDWQTLLGFFNGVAGSALPFHWLDANDNAAAAQGLGTGNGTATQFNFVRALGGFSEPVQDVLSVSQVTVAGTPTTAYSLLADPNWGLVYGLQFASAPAAGAAVAASFTYAWPCRFDQDMAQLENFMANFWQLKKISFETMKVL